MATTTKDLSVLVVEDSEAVRGELTKMYKSLGFSVLQAENGKVALSLLQQMKIKGRLPSLISSDVNMPEMDGVEFLHKVRADRQCSDLPFVIFTANKDELLKMTALCLDVNAYFLKPPEIDKLRQVLQKVFPEKKFQN